MNIPAMLVVAWSRRGSVWISEILEVPWCCCRRQACLLGVVVLSLALPAAGGVPALPDGAELVLEEGFRRAELGDEWRIEKGGWELRGKGRDRSLFGTGDGVTIVCTRPIAADMRIEYTTWSPNPGDRSLWLGFSEGEGGGDYQYRSAYLFQYGSYYSTRNAIQRGGAAIAGPVDAPMPVSNRRSRVVVQKQGTTLKMFVDGKSVFDVRDRGQAGSRRITGPHFGFYHWGDGVYFDDIKAYRLPVEKGTEPPAEVRLLVDFEAGTEGQTPRSVHPVQDGAGKAAVRNEPTFIYVPKKGETLVRDQCLHLHGPSPRDDENAGFSFRFKPLTSGQIEVELLARSYEGACMEVALLDKDGESLAALTVDGNGEFWAGTPSRGGRKLKDTIEFRHRGGVPTRLWIQPNRWFTIRLGFDAARGRFDAGIVNLFTGFYIDGMSWVPLGDGLPMRMDGGPVCGLLVRTLERADILVDNVVVYGPCGKTIDGKQLDLPLRKLLGLGFPLRKDPFTLSAFSLKNMPKGRPWNKSDRKRRRPTSPFVAAGKRYSTLAVRQAVLADSAQQVERMLFYLGETQGEARDCVERIHGTFDVLEGVYRAFGTAYVDSMSGLRLRSELKPKADAFEQQLSALERKAQQVAVRLAKARERIPPSPASLPDRGKHRLTWQDGHYRRSGVPDCFFPYHGASVGVLNPLLSLDHDRYVIAMAGFHAAWARLPSDWIERHGRESDVWCTGRFGKPRPKPYHRGYGGNVYSGLNFWNDEVLQMMFDMGASRAAAFLKSYPPDGKRIRLCKIAAEGRTQPGSGEAGFNPSAVKAFRIWLHKGYGTIAKLNTAWGTGYASFDDIDQGKYQIGRPNGLLYEFQRFRQEGYWSWIGRFMKGFRSRLPHVPIANDFNTPMGGYSPTYGYDMTKMFEVYDVVGCHSYDIARRWPTYRMLDSLRKAYGTPIGNQEWGLGSRMPRMFDEHAYFVHGLTDLFNAVAWGHSLWDCWYGTHPGWSEGFEFIEHRFDCATLRYSSACFPIAMSRCRRIGRVALEVPTVSPAIGILESTASFYNDLGVRTGMLSVAKALEKSRCQYDFLFERPLLEGQQSLTGKELIFVPAGLCMPDELQQELLGWLRRGGVLVAIGPVGLYDQYGRPAGRILRTAFPTAQWRPSSNRLTQCAVSGVRRGNVIGEYDKDGCILRARVGAGHIYVFTHKVKPGSGAALRVGDRTLGLLELLAPHVTRYAECRKGIYELVLRRRPGSGNPLWIYVVNPDFDTIVADELVVHEGFTTVDDVSLPVAFPVPFRAAQGETRIGLHLHPGEGALLRLTP